MVIKVYVSTCSGNMEIKKKQEWVLRVLQGRKVDHEVMDISDPLQEDAKVFMRENSVPKEGQQIPLPPQIFSEEDYCGDYDAFDEANEMDYLFEFLKLAPAKNVSNASVTITEKKKQNAQLNGALSTTNGVQQEKIANVEINQAVTRPTPGKLDMSSIFSQDQNIQQPASTTQQALTPPPKKVILPTLPLQQDPDSEPTKEEDAEERLLSPKKLDLTSLDWLHKGEVNKEQEPVSKAPKTVPGKINISEFLKKQSVDVDDSELEQTRKSPPKEEDYVIPATPGKLKLSSFPFQRDAAAQETKNADVEEHLLSPKKMDKTSIPWLQCKEEEKETEPQAKKNVPGKIDAGWFLRRQSDVEKESEDIETNEPETVKANTAMEEDEYVLSSTPGKLNLSTFPFQQETRDNRVEAPPAKKKIITSFPWQHPEDVRNANDEVDQAEDQLRGKVLLAALTSDHTETQLQQPSVSALAQPPVQSQAPVQPDVPVQHIPVQQSDQSEPSIFLRGRPQAYIPAETPQTVYSAQQPLGPNVHSPSTQSLPIQGQVTQQKAQPDAVQERGPVAFTGTHPPNPQSMPASLIEKRVPPCVPQKGVQTSYDPTPATTFPLYQQSTSPYPGIDTVPPITSPSASMSPPQTSLTQTDFTTSEQQSEIRQAPHVPFLGHAPIPWHGQEPVSWHHVQAPKLQQHGQPLPQSVSPQGSALVSAARPNETVALQDPHRLGFAPIPNQTLNEFQPQVGNVSQQDPQTTDFARSPSHSPVPWRKLQPQQQPGLPDKSGQDRSNLLQSHSPIPWGEFSASQSAAQGVSAQPHSVVSPVESTVIDTPQKPVSPVPWRRAPDQNLSQRPAADTPQKPVSPVPWRRTPDQAGSTTPQTLPQGPVADAPQKPVSPVPWRRTPDQAGSMTPQTLSQGPAADAPQKPVSPVPWRRTPDQAGSMTPQTLSQGPAADAPQKPVSPVPWRRTPDQAGSMTPQTLSQGPAADAPQKPVSPVPWRRAADQTGSTTTQTLPRAPVTETAQKPVSPVPWRRIRAPDQGDISETEPRAQGLGRDSLQKPVSPVPWRPVRAPDQDDNSGNQLAGQTSAIDNRKRPVSPLHWRNPQQTEALQSSPSPFSGTGSQSEAKVEASQLQAGSTAPWRLARTPTPERRAVAPEQYQTPIGVQAPYAVPDTLVERAQKAVTEHMAPSVAPLSQPSVTDKQPQTAPHAVNVAGSTKHGPPPPVAHRERKNPHEAVVAMRIQQESQARGQERHAQEQAEIRRLQQDAQTRLEQRRQARLAWLQSNSNISKAPPPPSDTQLPQQGAQASHVGDHVASPVDPQARRRPDVPTTFKPQAPSGQQLFSSPLPHCQSQIPHPPHDTQTPPKLGPCQPQVPATSPQSAPASQTSHHQMRSPQQVPTYAPARYVEPPRLPYQAPVPPQRTHCSQQQTSIHQQQGPQPTLPTQAPAQIMPLRAQQPSSAHQIDVYNLPQQTSLGSQQLAGASLPLQQDAGQSQQQSPAHRHHVSRPQHQPPPPPQQPQGGYPAQSLNVHDNDFQVSGSQRERSSQMQHTEASCTIPVETMPQTQEKESVIGECRESLVTQIDSQGKEPLGSRDNQLCNVKTQDFMPLELIEDRTTYNDPRRAEVTSTEQSKDCEHSTVADTEVEALESKLDELRQERRSKREEGGFRRSDGSSHEYENVIITRDGDNNTVITVKDEIAPNPEEDH